MNWGTVLWSMVVSAGLTLAGMNPLVWYKRGGLRGRNRGSGGLVILGTTVAEMKRFWADIFPPGRYRRSCT